MGEYCPKCEKSINSTDAIIICHSDDCLKKFHRSCLNIDEDLYDAIQKNPLISFNCDECKTQSPKTLAAKIKEIEEKLNKITFDSKKKHSKKLIVVKKSLNSSSCEERWVRVGNFAPTTSEDDIVESIADALDIDKLLVKCTKLVKKDADLTKLDFCAFMVSIPEYRFNELYSEAIWPNGVNVSHFVSNRSSSNKQIPQHMSLNRFSLLQYDLYSLLSNFVFHPIPNTPNLLYGGRTGWKY